MHFFLGYTSVPVHLSLDQLPGFINENCSFSQEIGPRRWACSICPQTFASKTDVSRHIEGKHVILPELHCPNCGKPLKSRHSLRIHMKSVHNMIANFEK